MTSRGRWIAPAGLILTVAVVSVAANFVDSTEGSRMRLLAGLIVVAALVYGAWHHGRGSRPGWLLVAFGVGGWVVGDALWDIFDAANLASTSGWFDVVNVDYLVMYPVIFVGLVSIAGSRGPRTMDSVIDSAVLFLSGVLLLQVFVVNPRVAVHTTVNWFAAIYPFVDALLLAAVGWLAFTHVRRNPALRLLGAGLILLVGVDAAWEVSQQRSFAGWDTWTNPLYPITYAVIAAAVLHPSAAHLTDTTDAPTTDPNSSRLLFLCAALGLIPIAAFLGTKDDPVVEVVTSALVVAIAVRITALVRTVQHAHRRFASLAAAVPVGIFESDAALTIVFANDQAVRTIGIDPVGMSAEQLMSRVADNGDSPALHEAVATVLDGRPTSLELRILDAQDAHRWLLWSAVPILGGLGRVTGAFVATTDITALKQAEEMNLLLATHDALTGLPNRRMLFDRLANAVQRLDRNPGLLAVLFLDLDGFKAVNDLHGHHAGDELLRLVASRIVGAVRAQDTVARLGGDEFVVVLERVSDSRDPVAVADKILRAIATPAPLSMAEVSIGVSIGGVMCSDPHADPNLLIHDADAAMYEAKSANGYNRRRRL